jgi:HD superfamily phosphodiesterase
MTEMVELENIEINTRVDLTPYEQLYENFDPGHDSRHLQEVRDFSLQLSEIHCPELKEVVYVSATLHDIGLSVERKDHERHGFELVLEDEILSTNFSQEEWQYIVEGIKEHRASTGQPQSVVARIVSDADKVGHSTRRVLERVYSWIENVYPSLNERAKFLRTGMHILEKFGEDGPGSRLYFPESEERYRQVFEPIFKAVESYSDADVRLRELMT